MESIPELHLSQEHKKPEQLLQRKLRVSSRPPSKPTIVRGVTYYKAQSTESENDIEEQRELGMQPWLVGWWLHSAAKPNGILVGLFAVVEGSSQLTALAVVGAGAEPSGASRVGSMGRRTNALTVQTGSALQGFVSSWR